MASTAKKTSPKMTRELARRQARGSTGMEGYVITPEQRKRAQELLKSRKRAAKGS